MLLVVAVVVPGVLPLENILSHYLWPWSAAVLSPGDAVVGTVVGPGAYRIAFWWVLVHVIALMFWASVGWLCSRWTLRLRTFHFVLLAYPAMLAVLWVVLAPLYLIFDDLLSVRLGTM
jgi:hypothetical protein